MKKSNYQTKSFQRYMFIDNCLKVVIRLQTSLLMLEFEESKSIFDRFLFISTRKSSRLKFFMQRSDLRLFIKQHLNFGTTKKVGK